MFKNRHDAAQRLLQYLRIYQRNNPIILALDKHGVPLGYEIAHALKAPLDVAFVKKIRFPDNPEITIGAIATLNTPEIFLFEDRAFADVPQAYIDQQIAENLDELHMTEHSFQRHRPEIDFTDRVVILVNDGITTGATMLAAVRRLRRHDPKHIVVATPVGSPEALRTLKSEADDLVCLHAPATFTAVKDYYDDFRLPNDEEVKSFLDQSRSETRAERAFRSLTAVRIDMD